MIEYLIEYYDLKIEELLSRTNYKIFGESGGIRDSQKTLSYTRDSRYSKRSPDIEEIMKKICKICWSIYNNI